MLSECFGDSSIRLVVPFIAPRQLGAVGGQLGRPNLPSVGWCTGQSGVPNRPLARPRVARRLRGRPLALATVGSPDSPVNHQTVR
jgi:hypothetical protein